MQGRADTDGNVTKSTYPLYRISGADHFTCSEKAELACELWDQFGIPLELDIMSDALILST